MRYPLNDPVGLASMVLDCREQMAKDGACVMPGFFTEEGVAHYLEQVLAHTPVTSEKSHNVFQLPTDPDLPADHARNMQVHAKIGFVTRSQLVAGASDLLPLYEWSPFLEFFKGVADEPLVLSADPEGAVYGTVNAADHVTAWHFDQHTYSAVAILQRAAVGGEFQFHPLTHDRPELETYSTVSQLLAGELVYHSINPPPGTLTFFRGQSTLHQVSTVCGSTTRVSAVWAFAPSAGFGNSEEVRKQNEWKNY